MPGGLPKVSFTIGGRAAEAPRGKPLDIAVLVSRGFTGLSESLKYRRPRFPYCHHTWCPHNEAVLDGRLVTASEAYPRPGSRVEEKCSLSSLLLSRMHAALRPGFYHSLPVRAAWPLARRLIARLSGLPRLAEAAWGEARSAAAEALETDVLVVGGGLAGLSAAAAAARSGVSVLLLEAGDTLGGRLGFFEGDVAGRLVEEARSRGARIMLATTYMGGFPEGYAAVDKRRGRLLVIKARTLVYAGGSVDALPVFRNNDLPGIVSSDYALRALRHGYRPSATIVLASRGTAAWASRIAAAAASRGSRVAIVSGEHLRSLELPRDAEVYDNVGVHGAMGRCRVRGLRLSTGESVRADMIVSSVARHPLLQPALQLGAEAAYCEEAGTLVPLPLPEAGLFIAGDAGCMGIDEARSVGEAAAEHARGRDAEAPRPRHTTRLGDARPGRVAEWLSGDTRGLQFVCLCSDLVLEDLLEAYRQGYASMEKLKRFTALGTGPCQGKTCMITAALLISAVTGRSLGEIGLFRQRAPLVPVEIGLLGARL